MDECILIRDYSFWIRIDIFLDLSEYIYEPGFLGPLTLTYPLRLQNCSYLQLTHFQYRKILLASSGETLPFRLFRMEKYEFRHFVNFAMSRYPYYQFYSGKIN